MIRTNKEAYRAGFASGFVSNSNEILERRKFQFSEVSVREEKKMRDAFHKGYYECQELIRKVNIEKAVNNSDLDTQSVIKIGEIVELKPHWDKKDFEKVEVQAIDFSSANLIRIFDDLLENSDMKNRLNILSRQGYSGLNYYFQK